MLAILFLMFTNFTYSQTKVEKIHYGGFEVGEVYIVDDNYFRFFLKSEKFCKKNQIKKALSLYNTWSFSYGLKKMDRFFRSSKKNSSIQNVSKIFTEKEKQSKKNELWFPKDYFFSLDENESLQSIQIYIAKQAQKGLQNTCFSLLFNQQQEAYLKRTKKSWKFSRAL